MLAPEETLPAGSYLASVYPSPQARRHRAGGIHVRVMIEYAGRFFEDRDIAESMVGAEEVEGYLTSRE